MIDRTTAPARGVAFLQGPVQKDLGMAHGLNHVLALAKARGNGCGQGAARTVIVGGMNLRLRQVNRVFPLPEEDVGDGFGRAFHMAPLDEHACCAAAQGQNPAARFQQRVLAADGKAAQHLGFGDVGCQDIGQGKLLPAEISAVFEAGVRADAGQTAPPQGLCLMEVKYP